MGSTRSVSTQREGNNGSLSKNLTIQAAEGFLSFQPPSRKEAPPVPRTARRHQSLVVTAEDRRRPRGDDP